MEADAKTVLILSIWKLCLRDGVFIYQCEVCFMPAIYNIVWSRVSAVETAYLPAGCGLGQINSLIHGGVWVGRGADWKSRTETKKLEEIGRGKAKVWVQERTENVKQEEAKAGERIKMTPDKLFLGSRIDVHPSHAIVISPANHYVTSTDQYHTL